jgi:hypothetical protein
MKDSFVIKYEFEAAEGFDLALIGSSFMGFDKVFKQILSIAGLADKVEVRTTSVRQGSVEVFNTIFQLDPLFIQDPRHLIEFLKIAEPELIRGFNTFMAIKSSVNEYYAKNPLDFEITLLITAYIIKSMQISGTAKKSDKVALESSQASPKQIKRLRKLVNHGYYKRALAPITHSNVTSVKLRSINGKKEESVIITEKNVGDFLPDTEQILPQFEDGDRVNLSGELQMLGSTHGDTLKLKVRDIDPEESLLTARLVEGLDIVEFAPLFKQAVYIDAEISRKTMFKRPELIIHKMTLLQERLEL